MKMLGVVIPTHWEAGRVLRRFHFKKTSRGFYNATINDRLVLLCISGVGRNAARLAAERLVLEGVGELVSMGFCGALIDDLRVGDLVTDRVATVDKPVKNVEERKALTAKANAVAVDMETQAIIEEGTRRGVPIHIRRVVSDTFFDDLTPLFGSNGSFSPWIIACRLLNPRAWPLAWRLRRNSRLAAAKLADAMGRYPQL